MPNKAGSGRYQNGSARRKVKARHIAAEGPVPICALCNKPIDLSIKTPDDWSCELDEIIPFSKGGSAISYDNTQLTHRICNRKKGNKLVLKPEPKNTKPSKENYLPLSREW
jgi:5-methylcytosine-specific restriction endonuclease McrA